MSAVLPSNVIIDERGTQTRVLAKPDSDILDGPDLVCRWLYLIKPLYFEMIGTLLARTETMRHFGGYQRFARGLNVDNLLLQYALTGAIGFARDATFKWRVYTRSHGARATPQELADAAQRFLHHVRTDPRTVEALDTLPPAKRKEIIDGIRRLTAGEFLRVINFYDQPPTLDCLKKLLMFPFDSIFYREIAFDYGRRVRARVPFGRLPAAAK